MTLAISTGVVAAIVVFVALDIFAVVFGLSFVRAAKEQRAAADGVPPAAKSSAPMSRRDFFRRSLLTSLMVFGAQFGGATIAFLWPNLKGGFGSLINAGAISDIRGQIASTNQPYYNGAGRFYVLDYKSNQLPAYDTAALPRAIREGEYDLQYVIYTLALHRWLRFRLGAAYAPHTHLGGVRYLFCRGLDRDDPAHPGIHALTLPPTLVESLDALFGSAA